MNDPMGLMRSSLVCWMLLSGGCASLATAPPPVVAPQLAAAWDRVRLMGPQPWTAGLTVAQWLDRLPISSVQFRILTGSDAMYLHETGEILIDPGMFDQSTAVLAGLIIHEAQHASGYHHTCGPFFDDPLIPMGAWIAHAMTLDILGEPSLAADLRLKKFCEVRIRYFRPPVMAWRVSDGQMVKVEE